MFATGSDRALEHSCLGASQVSLEKTQDHYKPLSLVAFVCHGDNMQDIYGRLDMVFLLRTCCCNAQRVHVPLLRSPYTEGWGAGQLLLLLKTRHSFACHGLRVSLALVYIKRVIDTCFAICSSSRGKLGFYGVCLELTLCLHRLGFLFLFCLDCV